jgi:hypothetical protein
MTLFDVVVIGVIIGVSLMILDRALGLKSKKRRRKSAVWRQ